MTRTVYINGRYLPYGRAHIHAEDRGFQFADAVYEVCEISGGRLVDETRHMDRLERSLGELQIAMPMSRVALAGILRETIRRNRVTDGLVYLQVSRGAGRRDFYFPAANVRPTLVCLARSLSSEARRARVAKGIAVKTLSDIRWGRPDIKTVMLLPACLAKEAARKEGAGEAWLVDGDGFVTEGASSNAWIIDRAGSLITRPIDGSILAGVTRATLMDLARREKIPVVERKFRVAEALEAREAFITSASGVIVPVIRIDDTLITGGRPGPITRMMCTEFHRIAEISCP